MKWMVLGSSPTAREFYGHPEVDLIGAAGDAITLCRPDYYFVAELRSLVMFVEERAAARKAGTKVILSETRVGNVGGPPPRCPPEAKKLESEWRDIKRASLNGEIDRDRLAEIERHLIELGSWVLEDVGTRGSHIFDFPHDGWMEYVDTGATHLGAYKAWEPGLYCQAVAGILALQYAVNHGATEVHMVGMEGYTGGVDYFTGKRGAERGAKYFREAWAPHTQRIVDKCPEIQFFVYGNPTYPLEGNNVRFTLCLQEA